MSQRFIGASQQKYIGTPYQGKPIKLCNGGNVVPLFFDWTAYGASSVNNTINVQVILSGLGVNTSLLKQLSSVYIDNTNSLVPIFVYCPDTQYSVVAQPNSAGWYPLYTNGFEIWVIGQAFTTGQIPLTQIFVSDMFVNPFTDLQIAQNVSLGKASASIQRGIPVFNSTYAAFALGDQFAQGSIAVETQNSTAIIFPAQANPGFIIITGLTVTVDCQQPFTAGTNGTASVVFESTGVSGVFMRRNFFLPTGADRGTSSTCIQPFANTMIYQSGPVQWKINAQEQWQVRSDPQGGQGTMTGQMFWDFTFTTNPT